MTFTDKFRSLIEKFMYLAKERCYFKGYNFYAIGYNMVREDNVEFVRVRIRIDTYVNEWTMLSWFKKFLSEKGLSDAYASFLLIPCLGCINIRTEPRGSFECNEFLFEAIKDDWGLFGMSPDVSIISSVSDTMEK